MTTDKFDGEYLEHRKIGLEKFLHRVASHPTLHNDDIFKAFLMKGEEWKEVQWYSAAHYHTIFILLLV